jgi:hypothetical protein
MLAQLLACNQEFLVDRMRRRRTLGSKEKLE